ncbi:uncharacterized protein NMK_2364 [Novimethylophilus kurashikiensis]|uniref:Uncharacterized protein n=1 Tax=Novimethylophilus kurashikiensis TaxID=1825523 RepID=A0A2R5FCW0_9PROT|nr:uncharacterized protein NMK_2364 [Novimethylophilus kurashikiensis]
MQATSTVGLSIRKSIMGQIILSIEDLCCAFVHRSVNQWSQIKILKYPFYRANPDLVSA